MTMINELERQAEQQTRTDATFQIVVNGYGAAVLGVTFFEMFEKTNTYNVTLGVLTGILAAVATAIPGIRRRN